MTDEPLTLDETLRGAPAELTEAHIITPEDIEDAAGEVAVVDQSSRMPAPAARGLHYDEAEKWAHAFVASGLFDANKVSQGIVKIAWGNALGIPPAPAMQGIDIIKGKLVINATLQLAMVQAHPRFAYRVLEWTTEKCVIEWYEDDEIVGQSSFTMDEARAAGLAGKDNWRKYPKAMLMARATSQGTRAYTPAIFGGSVYSEGELDA